MERNKIVEVSESIMQRGLRPALWEKAKTLRPTLSNNTVGRALKWPGEYDEAPPAIRLVLDVAKEVIENDNRRIGENWFPLATTLGVNLLISR